MSLLSRGHEALKKRVEARARRIHFCLASSIVSYASLATSYVASSITMSSYATVRVCTQLLGRAVNSSIRRIEHCPRPATIRYRTISTSLICRQEAVSAASDIEDPPLRSLTDGLDDPPPILDENERQVDWTRSFHGLSAAPFSAEQTAILTQELDREDIEVKPDGIVYLPEIKYRRILNKAFSPGGWGLAPRGETIVTARLVTREYGLVVNGRYAYFTSLLSCAKSLQACLDRAR